MNYSLKELSAEEAKSITEEIQAVLEKYDCEMGVVATMQIMKRQEDTVLSPIQPDDGNSEETKTD